MAKTASLPGDETDLDLLVRAATAAGEVALGFFRKDVQVWWKNGGTSPVTAADHAANDLLIDMLRSARPTYGWLSEESEDDGERLKAARVFVIDPIDGTRAFMNGLDTWVVSVAVVEAGRSIAGVLFAPSLGELYVADDKGRVEKNGQPLLIQQDEDAPIRVSAADDVMKKFDRFLPIATTRISRIPSLAYRLAMVADGRLDATIVKPNSHDWDLAAADLILRNAGGRLIDEAGSEPRYNLPTPRHGVLYAGHAGIVAALSAG